MATAKPAVEETGEKMFKIVIGADGKIDEDVYLSVNGQTYTIKREQEVVVPESVVEVLKNATKPVDKGDNHKDRDTLDHYEQRRYQLNVMPA